MVWATDKDGRKVWVGGSYYAGRGLSNTSSWEGSSQRKVRRREQLRARKGSRRKTFWGVAFRKL